MSINTAETDFETTYVRITNRAASNVPYKAAKQRFSKRINLTHNISTFPMVCEQTGAVATVSIPRIPHKVLTFTSPFAILANARGMAQEGRNYLKEIDINSVAAILITLADDYDLFHYQPSDSGAQKNALLRTVSKDILIDCILLIELFVNSSNFSYLPKLSLILDIEVKQSGIQVRMNEWMKLVVDRIKEPPSVEDMEDAPKRRTISSISYSVSAVNKARIALKKEFREWKKEAKETIILLSANKLLSDKAKAILIPLVSGDNLEAADFGMVSLVAQKLKGLEQPDLHKIATGLVHYKNKFSNAEHGAEKEDIFGDLESAEDAPISDNSIMVDRRSDVALADTHSDSSASSIDTEDSTSSLNEETIEETTISATSAANSTASAVSVLSFKERILLLKQQTSTKTVGEDNE